MDRMIASRTIIPASKKSSEDEPVCESCHGSGFVHPLNEDGEPIYGRVVRCPVCGGPTVDREALAKNCGLEYPSTFESYKHEPGTEQSFTAARDFTGADSTAWLLIYGHTGNGKTHLAKAVAAVSLNKGIQTIYWYVPSLLSELRSGMKEHTTEDVIDLCCNCQLLVLDDFGAEYTTEWAWSELEMILNRRYEGRRRLMVTTNVELTKLPRPILSRFKDTSLCTMVHNEGADYRPKMGKQ